MVKNICQENWFFDCKGPMVFRQGFTHHIEPEGGFRLEIFRGNLGNARKKSIFLCEVVPYLIMMTDTYVIIGFDDYRGCVVQNISSLLVFWVVDVKATKN